MNNELDRYSTPGMRAVWSADWKFRRWAEIETAAAEAQGAPAEALREMEAAEAPSPAAVAEEERKTHHDVVAFLNAWRRDMGESGRSWTHRGLTSSDVVDTANAMRMNASAEVIRSSLTDLRRAAGQQALEHRNTVRVGRTHGQSAETTTWGWRMAEFTVAVDRAMTRLQALTPFFAVGKLSGPVGDYKRVDRAAELGAMAGLGLGASLATSQVVMRDAYVDYLHALSQVANVVEAIATEVRLSARTDTGEVAEGFGPQQRGSSAMPHKRNPIKAEQLCGLARLVRAQVDPVAQGVALHHERDISHSSAERVALQTASVLVDYMVVTCTTMLNQLQVFTQAMRRRVTESPELMSAAIKDRLVEAGVDPKVAYDVVFHGFEDWRSGVGEYDSLADALLANWVYVGWQLKVDQSWTPEFVQIIESLKEPEQLTGRTDHVYRAIAELITPEDLPF